MSFEHKLSSRSDCGMSRVEPVCACSRAPRASHLRPHARNGGGPLQVVDGTCHLQGETRPASVLPAVRPCRRLASLLTPRAPALPSCERHWNAIKYGVRLSTPPATSALTLAAAPPCLQCRSLDYSVLNLTRYGEAPRRRVATSRIGPGTGCIPTDAPIRHQSIPGPIRRRSNSLSRTLAFAFASSSFHIDVLECRSLLSLYQVGHVPTTILYLYSRQQSDLSVDAWCDLVCVDRAVVA